MWGEGVWLGGEGGVRLRFGKMKHSGVAHY